MNPETDDSTLMERYRAGDIGSFNVLYRRHKDALYRYLLRLDFRRELVDDVFQETWGKIVNARHSYRATALFRTFLFRVARNCYIDHLRRLQRHTGATAEPDEQQTAEPGPEALTEHALLRRRLELALVRLPQEQRDAWLLSEEGGFGTDEIAEITGVNRETAKSRVRYATQKLRAALEPPLRTASTRPQQSGADHLNTVEST